VYINPSEKKERRIFSLSKISRDLSHPKHTFSFNPRT